jgi:hypothetical protein
MAEMGRTPSGRPSWLGGMWCQSTGARKVQKILEGRQVQELSPP